MADIATAEKINLEEVGRFFENKGYQVIKLEQIWRHVTGVVKHENEKLFLKLASTLDIGQRTRNECGWNINMNSAWNKVARDFRVPKVFDEGVYKDKYWYVVENVFGKPLVEIGKGKQEISEVDLDRAAMIAKNILAITDNCLLPKDQERAREIWVNRLPIISKQRAEMVKTKTKALLKYIEKEAVNAQVGVSHGDFVPWHILKTEKGGYFLIDAEHSSVMGLRFYDVAYFYHRVYTKLKRPDLAEYFLNKFKEVYKWSEADEKAFRPVLASRILGGYFDGESDSVTSMELNKEMEGKLLGEISPLRSK